MSRRTPSTRDRTWRAPLLLRVATALHELVGARTPLIAVLLPAMFLASCAAPTSPLPKPSIETVLRNHDQELMSRPGVVGVYIGLLDDGRTQCLKVMLNRDAPALVLSLPKILEGYRVVVEVSGPIKPY